MEEQMKRRVFRLSCEEIQFTDIRQGDVFVLMDEATASGIEELLEDGTTLNLALGEVVGAERPYPAVSTDDVGTLLRPVDEFFQLSSATHVGIDHAAPGSSSYGATFVSFADGRNVSVHVASYEGEWRASINVAQDRSPRGAVSVSHVICGDDHSAVLEEAWAWGAALPLVEKGLPLVSEE